MSRTEVSILIPVHNGEAYVGKAIRSLLAQSHQHHEIVILDDGSTDGSARVARAFGDPRVRVYRRDQHEGVGATRNHLLMAAHADLIAWLDADDVAFPDRLDKQVAYLKRHEDTAFVSSSFQEMDAQGQTLGERGVPTDHQSIADRLLHGQTIPMSTLLIRRRAIEAAGGFSTDLDAAADHDILLKIIEKSRGAALREPLVKCRVHARAESYVRRHEFRAAIAEARRRAVLRRHEKPLLFVTNEESKPAEAVAAAPTGAAAPSPSAQAMGDAPIVASENVATATAESADVATTTPAVIATAGAEAGATGEMSAPLETAGAANVAPPEDPPHGAAEAPPDGEVVEVVVASASAANAQVVPPEPAPAEATLGPVAAAAETGPTAAAALVVSDGTEPVETVSAAALVAVVLPVTGREALEAVRSVLDQSLRDLTLIVVATTADPGLERGLEILGDRRVRLLEAVGVSRARALNLGILASDSTYIAYLSETAIYRKNHLELLVETARAERLGFVYSDLGLATRGLEGATFSGHDFDSELLLTENYIPTETVVHRRALLHEVGLFNEGLEEGMEWELWAYLTRAAPARRVASATAERVVGGERGLKLIPPSPPRVRRFLLERFRARAVDASPTIQVSRDDAAMHGDAVARAHDRFRRGDWAGAAAELMDAASRPFNALGQLFSRRYPERESPLTDRVESPVARKLESRPRERVVGLPDQARALSAGFAPAKAGDTLTAEPSFHPGPMQLRHEPGGPPPAPEAREAAAPATLPARGRARGNNWLLTQSGMVGTGRAARTGANPRPRAPQPAATPVISPVGSPRKPRRKAMGTIIQNPPCPLCGTVGATLAHRAGWYRVLDCTKCTVAFSHPRLAPNLAARFFSERRPLALPRIQSAAELAGTAFDRSREIGWLQQRVPSGRIADIGCAWGYATAQLREAGYDAFGTELCRALSRNARERFGVEIFESDLEALALPPDSLDGVLALHVIQYVLEPRKFLHELFRVIRPGGVVVGTLPNFDSYLREELGRRWEWLDPESQSYHYRPNVLAAEFEAAGFTTELWTSEGLYGESTLSQLVGSEEAAELGRKGRGSEIGFIAIKRARA